MSDGTTRRRREDHVFAVEDATQRGLQGGARIVAGPAHKRSEEIPITRFEPIGRNDGLPRTRVGAKGLEGFSVGDDHRMFPLEKSPGPALAGSRAWH